MVSLHLLLLHAAGRAVALSLSPDPDRRSRAMAHGLGHALSHVDRLDRAGEAEGVAREVARRFGALAAGPAPAARALQALERIALAAGGRVELLRVLPARPALPVWSPLLRAGAPAPLFPFDPEAAAFRAGRRTLIKRDRLDPAEAAATAAWLQSQGLRCRLAGDVLFASGDTALLDRAFELEASLAEGGDARDRAARALGEALGYPPCCIEAYLDVASRDDTLLLARLLPRLDAGPFPAETQWLTPPLALVSHAPCSLGCAPTAALARAILELLEAESPGFAARWRALAARIQVVGAGGMIALTGTGPGADAVEIAPDGASVVIRAASPPPDLAAALAADHRG